MTNKIKVFRFNVSNSSSKIFENDVKEQWYKDGLNKLVSEIEIEKTVNEFLEDKQLVSLQVSTVEVCSHKSERGNTIDLIYTIVFHV